MIAATENFIIRKRERLIVLLMILSVKVGAEGPLLYCKGSENPKEHLVSDPPYQAK